MTLFHYKGNANKSGIYRIINKVNDKSYYGSAKTLKTRMHAHLSALKKGTHYNKYLQNEFNKYGEDSFIFEVVKVVYGDRDKRLKEEQKYIDQHYGRKKCYNILDKVKPLPNIDSKSPEQTKKKRSKSSKKMWQDPKYREKFSKSQKENWQTNEERRKKASERMKKRHKKPGYTKKIISTLIANRSEDETRKTKIKNKLNFLKERREAIIKEKDWLGPNVPRAKTFEEANLISPDGILYKKIRNLNAFAKEHGIKDSWKLQETIEMKRWQYKKWVKRFNIEDFKGVDDYMQLLKIGREKALKKSRSSVPNAKTYGSLIDPNGKIYHNITNVPTFAKKHSLTKQSVYQLLLGKLENHKGWKTLENREPKHKLISPEGKVYSFDFQKKFAKNHGLGYHYVQKLIHGKIKSYKGWRLFVS